MTTGQKVTNFYKEVKGRLTGDQNEVVAAKNQRKADSALNGQLAGLNSRLVDLEATVEDRQEDLGKAKYPTTLITDNATWINTVKRAYEALQKAEQDVKDVKASIEFFTNLQKENNAEVTAD